MAVEGAVRCLPPAKQAVLQPIYKSDAERASTRSTSKAKVTTKAKISSASGSKKKVKPVVLSATSSSSLASLAGDAKLVFQSERLNHVNAAFTLAKEPESSSVYEEVPLLPM